MVLSIRQCSYEETPYIGKAEMIDLRFDCFEYKGVFIPSENIFESGSKAGCL